MQLSTPKELRKALLISKKNYKVLIEGEEDNRYFGRAYFQAPDIDGVVFISEYNDKKFNIGDEVNVKIQDSEGYDLVGVVYD